MPCYPYWDVKRQQDDWGRSGSGRRETVCKSSNTASWLSRLESGLKRVICYSCTQALSWMYASPVRGESRAQQHANIHMKCKFVLALEGETVGILKCCLLFSENVVNIIRVPLCLSWYQGWEMWHWTISGGLVKLNLRRSQATWFKTKFGFKNIFPTLFGAS